MPFPWKSFRDWIAEEEKQGEVVRIKTAIKCGDPKSVVDAVPDDLKQENMRVNNQPGNLGKQMETELRAVGSYLHTLPNKPIGVIENPINNRPDIPIIINPWATRERSLRMFGCRDKEDLCRKYIELSSNLIPPVVVGRSDAPVKEIVIKQGDVDFYRHLPRCWVEYETVPWSASGGGQWVFYDPETGTHDLSETKSGFFEWEDGDPNRPFPEERRKKEMMLMLAIHNVTQSDAGRFYLERYRKLGRPLPAAYAMCNDPGIFGTAVARASLVWPENGIDEYAAAGGFRGEPVEVVESETIPGLMVPAHAEWVIEGEILPADDYTIPAYADSGYMGYMGGLSTCAIFRAKCITHRKDAQWCVTWNHDATGHSGTHMGALYVTMEAEAINYLRQSGYSVKDVVAYDMATIVVQTGIDGAQKFPRYGHTVLHALYGCPNGYIGNSSKFYIVVGPDINPYDLRDVLWALNTRVQPVSDTVVIERGGGMDPSCAPGPGGRPMFGEQVLIDALIKVPERVPQYPQRTNPVSEELKAAEQMRKKLNEDNKQ